MWAEMYKKSDNYDQSVIFWSYSCCFYSNKGEEACPYFQKALEKYNAARNIEGLVELGNCLIHLPVNWSERDLVIDIANACYKEVIRVDDLNYVAFRRYSICVLPNHLANALPIEI